MYRQRCSTDREGSPSQLFQPRHNPTTALPFPPPPQPLSLSTCPTSVLPAEQTLTRLFKELKIVYLLPVLCYTSGLLSPASVVCCFHRKLARRPLRWISCIARYLPVKVFCGFCIHLLLGVSLPLFPPSSAPSSDRCNCTII